MKCVLCSYLGKWPFITVGLRILIFFPSSEDAALTAEPMLPPSTQTAPLPPLLLALDHIARGTVCAQMDRPSCASQLCLNSANGSHAHLQVKTAQYWGGLAFGQWVQRRGHPKSERQAQAVGED